MKISESVLEIGEEKFPWSEIATLRLLNRKLAIELKSGQIKEIEIANLHPSLIDQAFRTFEVYLRTHPKKH